MQRPEFITTEDILRWNEKLANDLDVDETWRTAITTYAVMQEVYYAGQWLLEQLQKLQCDEVILGRILYTAGGLSFGRDPWEIHQHILQSYIDGELEYEEEPTSFSQN